MRQRRYGKAAKARPLICARSWAICDSKALRVACDGPQAIKAEETHNSEIIVIK